MKLLSVLIFFTALVYIKCNEEGKEKMIALVHECKEESDATEDDVHAMFKHEAAASKEAKCLRACIMQKKGILNEDGKLEKEASQNLIKHLAKGDAEKIEKGEEILDACVGIEVDDDHCEAAEEYLSCIFKEAKEHGFNMEE